MMAIMHTHAQLVMTKITILYPGISIMLLPQVLLVDTRKLSETFFVDLLYYLAQLKY